MCASGECHSTFAELAERYVRETVAPDSPLVGVPHRSEHEDGPLDEVGRCFFCGRDDVVTVPWDPPEFPQRMCHDCFDGYEYEHGYLDGIEGLVAKAVRG